MGRRLRANNENRWCLRGLRVRKDRNPTETVSLLSIDGDADSGSGGVRGGYASLCLGCVVQRRTRRGLSTMGGAESFGSSEMLIQGDGRISWKRNRALKNRGEVRKCFGELVLMNLGNFGCGCLVWGGYEAGDKEAWAGKSFEVKSGKIWACYSLVTTAHGMQQENGQIALHPNTSGQLDVAVVTRS
jgi:hypothetical protein